MDEADDSTDADDAVSFESLTKRSQSLKCALDQVKLLEEELDFAEKQFHVPTQPSGADDPEFDSIFKELEDWAPHSGSSAPLGWVGTWNCFSAKSSSSSSSFT